MRRQSEEQEGSQKHAATTQMMIDLYGRYTTMTPSAIIDELEQMHEFYAVASWAPPEERGGYFYRIIDHLSRAPLAQKDVDRLVAMLQWPELRAYKDRSAPFIFAYIARCHPSKNYLSILSEHLVWLEKEYGSLGATHYAADVASEIRITKEAIALCNASEVF